MTSDIRRRLDRLETAHRTKRLVILAVETRDNAQAAEDRHNAQDRHAFDLLVVITGVPRSPGDPLPITSTQPGCHP